MIKKLRRRFIAVFMLLTGLLLLGMETAIYISMYRSELRQTDRLFNMASHVEEGEERPIHDDTAREDAPPEIEFEGRGMPGLHNPAGFSSGWVKICLDTEDNVTSIFYSQPRIFGENDEMTDSSDRDPAMIAAAQEITAQGDREGVISSEDSSYRYRVYEEESGKSIVLADRTSEISSMSRLLAILVMIALPGLAVLFGLSVLLSKWAVVPIEDAWNRQKIFFTNASHELKTPLTVIGANLDVITADPDKTVRSQEKWFGFIREEADRMSRLIAEMLYLSREEQNTAPVRTEFDLSETAEGVCLSMDAYAFEQGKTITADIDKGISMNGEKESISRMLSILTDNAVKHSEEGAHIRVSLKRTRGRIRLSVENSGSPLSPEELERIFDRYYRTDLSRSTDTGGFGLGLAIARAIAERHGGTLTAHSEENSTVFTAVF